MRAPSRRVFQADALAWMDANAPDPRASVITSLPDVSELTHLDLGDWCQTSAPRLSGGTGPAHRPCLLADARHRLVGPDDDPGLSRSEVLRASFDTSLLEGWRAWFLGAARRVIRWVPREGVAIFHQSDVRVGGALVDKGYLVVRAAEEERASLLWHKIVCRKPPGSISHGRSGYSHMIAVTRGPIGPMRAPGPEVLPDAGAMPWSRAMGITACRVACRYLLDNTSTQVVVDPFCGRGTVLAVANELGLDAIGVDVSGRRCRAARAMTFREPARDETMRDALLRGAALFDRGEHFEAHEAWEERWRAATDESERRLFQGLVQVAAAFHKRFAMSSPEPALRLLGKALAKLDASPDLARELGLAPFVERVRECERALRAGTLQRDQLPRIGA